jgi:serine protease Do
MLFALSLAALAAGPVAPPAGFVPPTSVAPLVRELQPAVVHIYVTQTRALADDEIPQEFRRFMDPDLLEQLKKPRVSRGEGSGVIISEDGYILTNNHVIAGASVVKVAVGERETLEGTVVGADERTDVALIKVASKRPLPYAGLGSSAALEVGDPVIAIGNPFGLSHTVTTGIVSGKGRAIGAGPYDEFIQTDASINPGNSGGPLFDVAGRVVGINTAIIGGTGIGFSIPIDLVSGILPDLKRDGRVARGWLGVALANLDDQSAKELGAAAGGVAVSEVYPETPAADAGIQPGDVVLSINGRAVARSEDFIRLVGQLRPGDKVKLDLIRDGKARTSEVKLGERPAEDELAESSEDGPVGGPTTEEPTIGVRLRGTMVAEVDEAGPAAGQLQARDVITQVNGTRVKTAADIRAALAKRPGFAAIFVKRENAVVFVPVVLTRSGDQGP